MKAKVEIDTRSERDKYFDKRWEKLCHDAKLNPLQRATCGEYLRSIEKEQLQELLDICLMGSIYVLGTEFGFGTGAKSTKINRFVKCLNELLEEVFGNKYINGEIMYKYDGCALERLKVKLHRIGVEYVSPQEEPFDDRG